MIATDGIRTIANADAPMPTIDLPEHQIRMGVAFGLLRLAPDGVYELTEKGSTYLRGWIADRVKVRLGAKALAETLVSDDPALD